MNGVVMYDGDRLAVSYDGPDTAVVEVGVGRTPDSVVWVPAFLDFWAGMRVAWIVKPKDVLPRSWVWLRYSGVTQKVDRYQA